MRKVKIKPRKGLSVRKPDFNYLKEAGETVLLDSYWQRRINQGDVVKIKEKKAKS